MFFYQKKYVLLGIFLLSGFLAVAQKKTRILFLLDASSSMTLPWSENHVRFDVASNILLQIMDSVYAVNNEVEFAVRAYGTMYRAQEKNCTDTKLEVPFNYQNIAQIKTKLKYLKPIGFSPIAYSLEQAASNELTQSALYDYSIIFITDGGESCNGDICLAFSKFIQSKISIKPYVIGLDRNEKLQSYYACMGNYIDVVSAEDIPKAVNMIVAANRKIIEKPKQLNLSTTFSNTPIIKDTVKKTGEIIVISKNEFPRIDFTSYPFKVDLGKKAPIKPLVIKNKKKATLRFSLEEEAKEIVRKQGMDVFKEKKVPIVRTKMELLDNGYILIFEKEWKKELKPRSITNKNKKATLRFNWQEEVVRSTDVFPNLGIGNFLKLSSIKKVPQLKPIAFKKKTKATLRINWEIPIVRNTEVFPYLKIGKDVLLAIRSKTPSLKAITVKKKEKATLRFNWQEPVIRSTSVLSYIVASDFPFKVKSDKKVSVLKAFKEKKKGIATLRFSWEIPKKEVMVALKPMDYPRRMPAYATAVPQTQLPYNKQRPTLRITLDPTAKPVAKKDSTKKINIKPKIADGVMSFSVKAEQSAETQLQVFLVSNDGKVYAKATPRIDILDSRTKDTMYSFDRLVEGGQPRKETIQPGIYDIFIYEYNVARAYNVEIKPNQLNKVTLELRKGNLHFVYQNNIYKPIPYNAIVNRRFAEGATIYQKCTDVLEYEPGTYYVEITNSFPEVKRSIELSFYIEYIFAIPEPGTVQFDNQLGIKKAMIQYVLGDSYVNYREIDLSKTQDIQPGSYNVVFPINPKQPMAGNRVVNFKIESGKNTIVDIK